MNCYVRMEGVGSQKFENSLHCTTRVKAGCLVVVQFDQQWGYSCLKHWKSILYVALSLERPATNSVA